MLVIESKPELKSMLDKFFAIDKYIHRSHSPVSVKDIVKATGIHERTVQRLVARIANEGYAESRSVIVNSRGGTKYIYARVGYWRDSMEDDFDFIDFNEGYEKDIYQEDSLLDEFDIDDGFIPLEDWLNIGGENEE